MKTLAEQLADGVSLTSASLDDRSRALRRQIVRVLEAGKRGHVGAAFSLVEILRVLYDDVLNFDPQRPDWAERDRCILSKGHGCIALYVLLAEKGFFPESELWKFCHFDGILGGHPERGKVPGVEASTGSLGHGLPIAVGMAVAARIKNAKHRVYAVISDGESNEGSMWEAAMAASHHRLSNLTALLDYNKQQSYSSTYEVLNIDPLADKWRAFGFAVEEVDGHDVAALKEAVLRTPFREDKPSIIICHTIKGRGTPFTETNLSWHHKNKVSPEEVDALITALQ